MPYRRYPLSSSPGKRWQSRTAVEEWIVARGGRTASTVSRKTNYVLAGENPGSKLDKALRLKVPVIGEEDLYRLAPDNVHLPPA